MSQGMVRPAIAAVILLVLASVAHAASDLPRRIGMYPQSGAPLAMLDSDVAVRVNGAIVEATITQTFRNDTDKVTEATYIFPLPVDAAVSAMEIETATRTIRAAIEPRDAAKQRYERAIAAGVGAGLLEQERPDVFTQTVSAIPARGTVKVTLRFDSVARYQAGTWELVVPLVVAPRFVPGSASGRPTTGTGRAPDTDRAPDASRVTPGGAPRAGGATQLALEFAEAVDGVTSPTHELTATAGGYTLVDKASDHDAVIRWRAKAPTQAWVEGGDAGGFAAILVEGAPAPTSRKTAVRVVLVVDHAATTRGDAEAVQRPLVRALLSSLEARDSVALAGGKLVFGSAAAAQRALDERPRTTAPFDLSRVLAGLRGDQPTVLVSDGLVADDRAVLAAAAKLRAPVHVIGTGPAPNRGLLAGIAAASGGTVRFAHVGDDLGALARDVLADTAAQPERIAINWGALAVSDVVPANPRLGAGQALLVVARVKQVRTANARVRGDVFGFVDVPSRPAPDGATTTGGVLARRWAKARLDELVSAGNAKAITEHALRYGLVSPMTAMVAIGDEVVVKGGVKHTVPVPVSVPAGMQWQLVKQQTTVDTSKTSTFELEGRLADAPHDKRKKQGAKAPAKEAPERRPVGSRPTDRPRTTATTTSKPKTTTKTTTTTRTPPRTATPPRRPVSAGAGRTPIAAGPAREPVSRPEPTAQPTAPAPENVAPTQEEPAAPPPMVDANEPGASDDESRDADVARDAESLSQGVATAGESAAVEEDEDSLAEATIVYGTRSRLRLSLALGAGLAAAEDQLGGFAALTARAELARRRTSFGLEGSLWLVDELGMQGSLLGTVSRRMGGRLELGGGLGLRITGDAIGPALGLTLRTLLPIRGLATYLRYDGALLQQDGASRGINAGSFGIEARW